MRNYGFLYLQMLMTMQTVCGLYMIQDRLDNIGNEFVLMFMNQKKTGLPFLLFLTTPQPSPVTVRIRTPHALSAVTIDMTLLVYNTNLTNVVLPETLKSSLKCEKTYKSLLVTSDDVIVLYASNMQHKSTDSIVIYPTDTLSNEYIAVSRISDKPNPAYRGSQIGVVALGSGVISFYLPPAVSVLYNSTTYTEEMHVTLNMYEVFHLVTTDVTGIVVKASIKMAVFCGHSFMKFGEDSGDHMEVMLPPIQSLDLQYLVARKPSIKYRPELIRIVSTSVATHVNISNGINTTSVELQIVGSYFDYELASTSFIINADKAILVAHISPSRSIDGQIGDSSMSLAFCPNYLSSFYTFGVPATSDSNLHQYNLLIVVEETYVNNVLFDEVPLGLVNWTNIADSGFVVTEIEDITDNRHTLSSDGPEIRMAGVINGFGYGEQFQTVIGRYLGVPRDQINTTKDEDTEPFRESSITQRFIDYLPSEDPFYNVTTRSRVQCSTLCLEYSACYLLATRSLLGVINGPFTCALYTSVAASGPLQPAPGYTLYRRFS